MKQRGVTKVLDIGANTGQYAQELFRHGFERKIISFEPLSECFRELDRIALANPNWHSGNCAIGESDVRTKIKVSKNTLSSSLLSMLELHQEACPESCIVREETVQVRRLATIWGHFIDPNDSVWIKLDVQGYESQVLNGLGPIPASVVAIELELSLVPLYEGQQLLQHFLCRLENQGFRLVAIEDVFWNNKSQETLQVNGIFLR